MKLEFVNHASFIVRMLRSILLALLAVTLFQSCHTFVGANGSKQKKLFPAKDRTGSLSLDTSRFIKRPFDITDYVNKKGFDNGKKVIEPIEGVQLQQLANTNDRYILFFCYPCPANRARIRKLDSLNENVLLVWLTTGHNIIDSTCRKTRFSQYPYYTVDAKKNSKILLERKIRFTKEACPQCYEQYQDEVMFAEYLVVENGAIRMVTENDSANILRR
jgi:hypothetical protein